MNTIDEFFVTIVNALQLLTFVTKSDILHFAGDLDQALGTLCESVKSCTKFVLKYREKKQRFENIYFFYLTSSV